MTVKLSLATVPLFQFMPAEELTRLAAIGRIVEKNAGELIVMLGEPVPGIFLVGEGAVGVHAVRPERQIAELKTGESFGEMSYLENTRASATIRASVRATKIILFTHGDLRQLVEKDPLVGRGLFHGIALQLSKKLRATTTKLADELAAESAWAKQVQTETGKQPLAVVSQLAGFRQLADAELDACLAGLDELAQKVPDKPGSLGELTARLGDLRAKARAFLPRLETQVFGMASVLTRLADLASQPHG